MELLDMLLDVLDAIAGAVGFASLWVTWVRPRPRSSLQSGARQDEGREADEIERFLHEASRSSREACV